MEKDFIKIKGTVEFWAERNGKIIDHWVDDNLIVNLGKESICYLLATGNVQRVVNKIGFGTGQVAPELADTALTGAFVKSIGSSITYPAVNKLTWDWELGLTEGNGAGTVSYYEMGLFSNNNTLFSRKVRAEMVKNSATRFFGTWTLTF